ncbi:MAG: MFS transporter [Actinomycetia bacterium]|nr:MFS transporter [Actinomycetes bacterium]MCP5034707.1 MFS transporter [Actinomycetes bacterium]
MKDRLLTWRFVTVTVAGLAYFTGWTILYPVLPRFVEDELGGTGVAVGLAVGSFGITAALLRPVAGRLGDRYGRRVLVVGGMLVVAVSLVGYFAVTSVVAVVGLRLLFGAGEAFAFVGLATAIQDMATDDRRGEAANYFSVAVYGGVAAGPPIGEWLFDGSQYDRVWTVAVVLVLLGAVLGFATPSIRAAAPSTQSGWIHPEAILPGLALTSGLVGYAGFVSFVAIYADSIGMAGAGWVFATYAGLIMLARLLAAKVPDRFGASRVSALSLVGIGTGLIVIAAIPSPVGLYGGVVVFSAGMSMNFPALMALVVNRAHPNDRAFVVASLSVFFDLAFAVGALVIGFVVVLANERAAFAVGGVCAIAGLIPLRASSR